MLRYVTDEIMAAVQDQSGQEYVDAYGASVKAALADGRELASAVVVDAARAGSTGATGAGATAETGPTPTPVNAAPTETVEDVTT